MTERAHEIFRSDELTGDLCPILPTAIDPDALAVLRRLHQARHKAYLVGGCVRDLLIGGTPKDFDIATSARPRQVKKLFRNARIIGRRFRLVHVMFGPRKQIEVSTFRRGPEDGGAAAGDGDFAELEEAERATDAAAEVGEGDVAEETDARAPAGEPRPGDVADEGDEEGEEDLLIREDNVYGSEAEDAVRRDFTINGLFFDVQHGCVLDYVGGVADLRRRMLRTIGDPSRRLREDPVRILRAVKFSSRLQLALEPRLAAAMAEHHEDLRRSAPPRVFEEILRILSGPSPEKSIEVLVGLGVVHVLFPELGLRPHGGEPDPRLARLLARLAALSVLDRGQRSLPTAIYLGVLFYEELLARLVGSDQPSEGPHPSPSQALDDFLRPIGVRCRMARRDTARVRALFLALRRVDPVLAEPHGPRRRRRGGLGDFVRREFFEDALLLLRIVSVAEGRDLAPVLEWERRRDELVAGSRHGHHGDSRDPRGHGDRDPRGHQGHRPLHAGPGEGQGSGDGSRDGAPPGEELDEAPAPEHGAAGSADAAGGRRRRRRRRRRGSGGAIVPTTPASPEDGPDDEPA
jgi:poly(A) polymerase